MNLLENYFIGFTKVNARLTAISTVAGTEILSGYLAISK